MCSLNLSAPQICLFKLHILFIYCCRRVEPNVYLIIITLHCAIRARSHRHFFHVEISVCCSVRCAVVFPANYTRDKFVVANDARNQMANICFPYERLACARVFSKMTTPQGAMVSTQPPPNAALTHSRALPNFKLERDVPCRMHKHHHRHRNAIIIVLVASTSRLFLRTL